MQRTYTFTATIAVTDLRLIEALRNSDELHPIVLNYFVGWTRERIEEECGIGERNLREYIASANPMSKAKRKTPPPPQAKKLTARIVRELIDKGDRPVSPIPANLIQIVF